MNLSKQEQSFFTCLEAVDEDTSLWAMAIVMVVKEKDPNKFRTLVAQLKSQAKDNPAVMKGILGEPCYQQLVNL